MRCSADDQRRFDSYYSRWLEYRRTNNREEVDSMEKRMRDVMSHYNIPSIRLTARSPLRNNHVHAASGVMS